MPELPEVETIRRQLEARIVARRIVQLDWNWAKSVQGVGVDPQSIVGSTVLGLERRGKVLAIAASGNRTMLVHLRMTGQFVHVEEEAERRRWTSGHTRATLGFDDGSAVLFNDQRKFGRLTVIKSEDVADVPFLATMGPEPLEAGFDGAVLHEALQRRRKQSIKTTLLDQRVVAGIGNIYVDEALFEAGIDPERPGASLGDQESEAVANAIKDVLSRAIELGGSTLRNYRDAQGRPGGYLDEAQVVGRADAPCWRCGRTIAKIKVGGRGTYVCPSCQPPASQRGLPG